MERGNPGVLVAARISPRERAALRRAAAANDRTPSREIRRAIRFYLAHATEADRFLSGQAT